MASAFERDGFVGPLRLLSAEQCRVICDYLRRDGLQPPAEWFKGRAVTNRVLYDVAATPVVLALLRRLLGESIILWGARLIKRESGQAHAWHTDIESSAANGGFVTIWIGLENTSQGSALQLIARSHSFGKTLQQVRYEKGVARTEATADQAYSWAKELNPLSDFVQPEMSDGEALVSDGRLWHGSFNSRRRGTRLALLLQYAEASRRVRMPDSQQLEWPFRFLEEPNPPVILMSGSSPAGKNRIVPPPAAEPDALSSLPSQLCSLPLPLEEEPKKGKRSHGVFRGRTSVLGFIGCHISVLSGGHVPHPPHAHVEEELLIPLEGEAELLISNGPEIEAAQGLPIGPGAFVYYPSYQHHTIRNPGEAPITYLMFKWRGVTSRAASPSSADSNRLSLPTQIFAYAELRPEHPRPKWSGRLFRRPTSYLEALSSHVTVLQPGAGYEPHVDPYDVCIVLLSGMVSTLGETITAPGVIFFPAGEAHGMRNTGESPARYLVFEFHPAKAPDSLLASTARPSSALMLPLAKPAAEQDRWVLENKLSDTRKKLLEEREKLAIERKKKKNVTEALAVSRTKLDYERTKLTAAKDALADNETTLYEKKEKLAAAREALASNRKKLVEERGKLLVG